MDRQIDLSDGQGTGLMKLGDLWCSFMHASPMWPIHGHYECAECGRRYLVPWEVDRRVQGQTDLAS